MRCHRSSARSCREAICSLAGAPRCSPRPPITRATAGSVQLFGTASTYFRYVQRLDRMAAGSQSGQLGAGVRLPKQGSLQITQAAAYSPSYLYQLFPTAAPLAPGEAIPVNPEYRIDQTESYSYRHENGARVRLPARNSPDDHGRIQPHRFQQAAAWHVQTSRRTRPARDSPALCHAEQRSRPGTSTAWASSAWAG